MATRVYFDTNIWISAMDSKDPKNPAAINQFEQVRQGKQTLVISKWVFLEIIKFIIDKAMRDPSIQTSRTAESIKGYTKTVFSNYGNLVVGMKHVRFTDPKAGTSYLLQRAYQLSQEIFGHATKDPKCPICHAPHDFFQYHGPYQVDFIHALIARDLQCQKMLTFDNDFSLLKNDPLIQPLSIEVLKS